MATTTIPWDDGSGDNIYLTYSSASGDQTVEVSSDANTGSARTQTVTFTAGSVVQILTVNQDGGPQQYTLTKYPSSYDTTDHSYYALTNPSNAYTNTSSTSYCRIRLTTGSQAETWIYFEFDTSSIPANAVIDEVSCSAKTYKSNGTTSNIAIARWQLYSGTTPKGDYATIAASQQVQTITNTSWTREEVSDLRLRMYAKRGTQNTSTNTFDIRLYGAELTIKYTV